MRIGSFALLLALACSAAAQTPRIRVEATDAYIVSRAGQKVAGPALDLTKAVLQRAGVDYSVEVAPWARAYSLASHEPNVLLFTLGRTPEREAAFNWIGPTFPIEYAAWRLKERTDIAVHTAEDLRKYRLSVVRDSAIVPVLRRLKLPEDRIDIGIQFIPTARDHWAKLERGHVDLFVATRMAVQTMCLRGDLDCGRIATAWRFPQPRVMAWMAMSDGTPADVVKRIAGAYRALHDDGSFDRLMAPDLKGGER